MSTIYEQLVEVFSGSDDRIISILEIRSTLQERFGTNATSILPSDYCYNRWNQGVTRQKPLFVRVGSGEYRYLGPDHPFTGVVFWRPKGARSDEVAGERINGELRLYSTPTYAPQKTNSKTEEAAAPAGILPLSQEQLDRLYEEYMEILALEVGEFGCKPTETRHLIGRLGEFYCARVTGGQLARRVNQPGFDVVGGDGRRISVKTTAQRTGFVSLNSRTVDRADSLMVLQYDDGAFEVVFHGDMQLAIGAARVWEDRYELDLGKARKLSTVTNDTFQNPPASAVRVVAAVLESKGKYLICERPSHKRHGGMWEFPGGKVEPNETTFDAVAREIAEELGVVVHTVAPMKFSVADPGSNFVIEFLPVEIVGEPAALEHSEIRWAGLDELLTMNLAPSDRKFAEFLLRSSQ